MITAATDGDLQRVEAMMDLLDQPMFLVAVGDDGSFRFRKINLAHERDTGVDGAGLEGARPHDVLPGRIADTVVANYARCVRARARIAYEEMLELGGGPRWWLTHLSPIVDLHGNVVAVLGSGTDITAQKEREFEAVEREACSARMNADLQVFAAAVSHDAAVPLKSALALLQMVGDGFVDLGDGRAEQIRLCADLLARLVARTEEVSARAAAMPRLGAEPQEVALAHLCRDILAVVDPGARLEVSFAEAQLMADLPALQLILGRLIGHTARHAATAMSIGCIRVPGGVAFTVADDGPLDAQGRRADGSAILPAPDDPAAGELASVAMLVDGRGGSVTEVPPPAGMTAAIRVITPRAGILEERAGPTPRWLAQPTFFDLDLDGPAISPRRATC